MALSKLSSGKTPMGSMQKYLLHYWHFDTDIEVFYVSFQYFSDFEGKQKLHHNKKKLTFWYFSLVGTCKCLVFLPYQSFRMASLTVCQKGWNIFVH